MFGFGRGCGELGIVLVLFILLVLIFPSFGGCTTGPAVPVGHPCC